MKKCEAITAVMDLNRLAARIFGVVILLEGIRDEIGDIDAGPDMEKVLDRIREMLRKASAEVLKAYSLADGHATKATEFAVYMADDDDEC